MDLLCKLYERYAGYAPETITKLPGAGSNRRYYRLGPKPTLIGVYGTSRAENEAFIYLSRHFHALGLPVPEVLDVADDSLSYLVSDLGDTALFDLLHTAQGMEAAEKALTLLPDFQWRGAEGLDTSRLYPVPAMDRRSVMWDLNYFKYCFLKAAVGEIDEPELEDDFLRLSEAVLFGGSDTFMYRDFQSRNVMITPGGEPAFIDFQGGRLGPWLYDAVSFLWQARAGFTAEERRRLLDVYLASAARYDAEAPEKARQQLVPMVIFRTLQVLGAYGFRGFVERKAHFLKSIAGAVDNLRSLLDGGALSPYPAIAAIASELAADPRFSHEEILPGLTVKVSSFGYNRHGIPADTSGNGGGYVFDCRGLHNPGRYEPYKKLTGRDREVIDFLESDSNIRPWLDEAMKMVSESVEVYLRRGFTSLSVSFGCTGGRHRSVYSAEHAARFLRERWPELNIVLTHHELGISVTMPSQK